MTRRAQLFWYALPAALLIAPAVVPYLPNTIRQNDSVAIGRLRRVKDAQDAYSARYPTKGFACRLSEIQETSEFSGYKFRLFCPDSDAAPAAHYEITAEPAEVGRTGVFAYCMTESGVLWYDEDGSGSTCLRLRHVLRRTE